MFLVTGASGFIGSNLCRVLTEKGEEVRAFYRERSNGEIPLLLQGLPVDHTTGDITNPISLSRAMQGVEVVFHAAAKLGSVGKPEIIYGITVEGTRNVLMAARQSGVKRVVHTSSVAALGVPGWGSPPDKNFLPINENHTWNFPPGRWRYGHSKYLAELVVQEAVALGQDVVIVNPGVVLGAGDINRVGGGVVINVAQGRFPVTLPGGLNVVHIEDVVAGQLAALNYGRTGERYILGGKNLTIHDFHRSIARIAGVHPPRFVLPGRPIRALAGPISLAIRFMPFSSSTLHRVGYYFYYDNQKSREELKLSTPLPVEKAIQDTYTWYRDHGIL